MLDYKISRSDSFCEEGVAFSYFCVLSRFICLFVFNMFILSYQKQKVFV